MYLNKIQNQSIQIEVSADKPKLYAHKEQHFCQMYGISNTQSNYGHCIKFQSLKMKEVFNRYVQHENLSIYIQVIGTNRDFI